MDENTISYKLDRIKHATDRIRTKTGVVSGTIEEVATAVENMDDINSYFNSTSTDNSILQSGESRPLIGGWKNLIKKIPKVTNKLTSYESYFNNLLGEVDVTGLDTSIATNMHYMFGDAQSVTTLDVSNFNTENVTDMSQMFCGCSVLPAIDVSSFNTSKVTNMYGMFMNCPLLTELDLSNFNIDNVTDVSYMFKGGKSLSKIDFRNANFSNAKRYQAMLMEVPKSCLIIVKDDTQKAWMKSKFSSYTNVKTVAEYEGLSAPTDQDIADYLATHRYSGEMSGVGPYRYYNFNNTYEKAFFYNPDTTIIGDYYFDIYTYADEATAAAQAEEDKAQYDGWANMLWIGSSGKYVYWKTNTAQNNYAGKTIDEIGSGLFMTEITK